MLSSEFCDFNRLCEICMLALLQILIATGSAEYLCVKPASGYKKVFAHIAEQADIFYEASSCVHSVPADCPLTVKLCSLPNYEGANLQ